MGLSRRRRAKKDSRRTRTNQDEDLIDADPHQQTHQSTDRRTGNTYRRVFPHAGREKKYNHLLSIGGHESNNSVFSTPRSQRERAESDVQPNANLCNPDMIHISGNDYSRQAIYSLNKHGHWRFPEQLKEAAAHDGELKDKNLFLVETVSHNSSNIAHGASVRCVTSNVSHMMHAADELRKHCRTSAKPNTKYQSRKPVVPNDRFEFSDQIKQEMTDRRLKQIGKASGGCVNAKSVLKSCSSLKSMRNLSPTVEQARMSLQDDYDARMQIFVITCVPSPDIDVQRCCRVEKENHTERIYGTPLKDFPYHWTKWINHMVKKARKCDLEIQLELDGNTVDTDYMYDDVEETSPCHRPKEVTMLDVMRPKSEVSANRANKLAMKAQRMAKKRGDGGKTAESSGYNSDIDISDVDVPVGGQSEAKATANQKLADAMHAALTEQRPTIQVAREFTDDSHITNIFGTDSSGSVMVSNSLPRKLAVLLRPDLSESIVFEEAVAQNPASVTYTVHHSCCADKTPKTSAQEVALHVNPFAFLRSLVQKAPEVPPIEKTRHSDTASVGWRRANVLAETDARVTAIRALPMFTVAAADDSSEAVLVPSVECEICCQQLDMDLNDDTKSFAEGSTMLKECGHHFCNKCWLQHVASSVSQGRVGVTCPGHKCQSVVDAATMLWFCPSKLLSALTSAAFRAWLTERKSGIQRRFCPLKNCGRLLECRSGVNAVCGACRGGVCLDCGQDPHWPADCDTAARYKNKMQQLGHLRLTASDLKAETRVNAKKCPTCHLIMEKGPGCNHMTCPCGEHFCWWCGQTMAGHSGGACNTASQSFRPPSSFVVKEVMTAKELFLVPNGIQSRLYCEAVNVRLQRMAVQNRLGISRARLTDLFTSYAFRFANEDGGLEINNASRTALRLTDGIMQASHLVEYTYTQLDRLPRDKRFRSVVREFGSLILHLIDAMVFEIQLLYSTGYRGPKHTRAVCHRLLMLLGKTQDRCRIMYALTANRMSRRLDVMSISN